MRDQLHPVDGKEIRRCCSSVYTCVDVVQHESTKICLLAALMPDLKDLRQTVLHEIVSADWMSVQKGYRDKMASLRKERSHHLLSSTPQSLSFSHTHIFQGKCLR